MPPSSTSTRSSGDATTIPEDEDDLEVDLVTCPSSVMEEVTDMAEVVDVMEAICRIWWR